MKTAWIILASSVALTACQPAPKDAAAPEAPVEAVPAAPAVEATVVPPAPATAPPRPTPPAKAALPPAETPPPARQPPVDPHAGHDMSPQPKS